MKKTFEDKMDMVDLLENVKDKVSFMSLVCAEVLAAECRPGEKVISGMYIILNEIAEQVGTVSEEIQHNVYEVSKVKTHRVATG